MVIKHSNMDSNQAYFFFDENFNLLIKELKNI